MTIDKKHQEGHPLWKVRSFDPALKVSWRQNSPLPDFDFKTKRRVEIRLIDDSVPVKINEFSGYNLMPRKLLKGTFNPASGFEPLYSENGTEIPMYPDISEGLVVDASGLSLNIPEQNAILIQLMMDPRNKSMTSILGAPTKGRRDVHRYYIHDDELESKLANRKALISQRLSALSYELRAYSKVEIAMLCYVIYLMNDSTVRGLQEVGLMSKVVVSERLSSIMAKNQDLAYEALCSDEQARAKFYNEMSSDIGRAKIYFLLLFAMRYIRYSETSGYMLSLSNSNSYPLGLTIDLAVRKLSEQSILMGVNDLKTETMPSVAEFLDEFGSWDVRNDIKPVDVDRSIEIENLKAELAKQQVIIDEMNKKNAAALLASHSETSSSQREPRVIEYKGNEYLMNLSEDGITVTFVNKKTGAAVGVNSPIHKGLMKYI